MRTEKYNQTQYTLFAPMLIGLYTESLSQRISFCVDDESSYTNENEILHEKGQN